MYQRIILTPYKSGAEIKNTFKRITDTTTLPKVFNINNSIEYEALNYPNDTEKKYRSFNSRYYASNGKLLSISDSDQANGIIGNKKYEFFIDFYSDKLSYLTESNEMVPMNYKDVLLKYLDSSSNTLSTIKLHDLIFNDNYIAVSSAFLLENNNFYLYELNDYSYQAMTINNYDYDIKVFYKAISGYSEDKTPIYQEYKLPSGVITLLKSFTYKKAWILLDSQILGLNGIDPSEIDHIITKIIIDFKYKDNKFTNLNYEWNLSSYFLPLTNTSSYYDQVYLKKYSSQNLASQYSVLNKQEDYFYIDNESKEKNTDFLFLRFLLDETPDFGINKFKEFIIDPSKISYMSADNIKKLVNKYATSSSYEVYEYTLKNIQTLNRPIAGRRILNTSDITNKFYEVYPIMATMAHYIFQYNENLDFTNIENTIAKLKKSMYDQHIYLAEYNIQNIFSFNFNGNKYIETYIPISFDGRLNYAPIDNTVQSITGFTYNFQPKIQYNGSFYDPHNLNLNGSKSNNLLLPYFYSDNFIPKNKKGTPFIFKALDSEQDTYQACNLEFKHSDIKNIDIRAIDGINKPNILININSVQNYKDMRNQIDTANIDYQLNIIRQNLVKLITENELTSNTNKVKIDDCLFAYFYVPNMNKIKFIKKYKNGETTINYITPIQWKNHNVVLFPSEGNNKNNYVQLIQFESNYNIAKVY